MTDHSDDHALDQAIAGLPRAIDPPRDLWPQIERRLEKRLEERLERRTPSRRQLGWSMRLAAAAVVLIAILLPSTTRDEAPSRLADVYEAEAEYRQAATNLAAVLDQYRAELDPETLVIIEQNLVVIDGAVAETRAALERDPENVLVASMLTRLHHQKLALLKDAARLAGR